MAIIEPMARYHYIYDLKPMGPHRRMAQRLLGSLRRTCGYCEACGLISSDHRGARPCPWCEGTGGVWAATPEEVEAAWALVAATYPGQVSYGRSTSVFRDPIAGHPAYGPA